jgi:hypothetical protein
MNINIFSITFVIVNAVTTSSIKALNRQNNQNRAEET